MMFNVPQFIDVEDKVAGPLTAKQLFWMIGMFAIILVIATVFPGPVTYIIAVPVVILFVLLAFYRPGGFPLISYVTHGFFFLFRPKLLVWSRPKAVFPTTSNAGKARPTESSLPQRKTPSPEDIRRVARMMDGR
ncbi:MAG: PrgI family protein [Candidatus Moranbacteria bacterium]|nr:PrgI family protein [Candidatus Moranbacteria bacterium]NTW45932.1 PrgI family protein [Candidatus Moranbacteria bacterium]